MEISNRYRNVLTSLLLIVVVAAGFYAHLKLFSKTPYVNGTDGGFYAYKVRELVEEGEMDWNITSSPPLIFLTSAAFAKFFGVFDGVKMGTAFFSALLGASVFLLTHHLSKSKKAALAAAFFAIVSPMSLRIAADIRKNVVVLVFMPLIAYFYLKFAEALPDLPRLFESPRSFLTNLPWKYTIPLAVTMLLGLLSHSSIITIWFAFLAYLTLYLPLKKKLPPKEFIPIFAANLILVALFAIFYDKFSDKLEAITVAPAMLNGPQFEDLNIYILPLLLIGVPGTISALAERRRGDIFLVAWTLLLFLLTLSQTVGPSEYWRFVLIMFVPVTVLAGCGIAWLLKKIGIAALIAPLVVAYIVTQQFFAFGRSHFQMFPQLNERILVSLETAADQIPRNSYVYTGCAHHNYYWVRYFFGINTRRYPEQNISEINDLINQNHDVYIARGAFEFAEGGGIPIEEGNGSDAPNGPAAPKVKGTGSSNPQPDTEHDLFEHLETVYEDDYVQLLKITASIKLLGTSDQTDVNNVTEEPGVKDSGTGDFVNLKDTPREYAGDYETSRLRYLSTYLILPYEAINAINPPRIALWQIELGLPLSILLIGLAASLFIALAKRLSSYIPKTYLEIASIVVGAASVIIIYGFTPAIFWGAPQIMVNGEPPPPDNGQEKEFIDGKDGKEVPKPEDVKKEEGKVGYPCGDGICDEAEQADPTLCPEDCP